MIKISCLWTNPMNYLDKLILSLLILICSMQIKAQFRQWSEWGKFYSEYQPEEKGFKLDSIHKYESIDGENELLMTRKLGLYDLKGRLVNYISYNFNPEFFKWEYGNYCRFAHCWNAPLVDREYDAKNRLILYREYRKDSLGNLIFSNLELYDYFDNGKVKNREEYAWDNEQLVWVGSYKYQDLDSLDSNWWTGISYQWNDEKMKWIPHEKESDIIRDERGNVISATNYTWDEIQKIWVVNRVYECTYKYDEEGREILREDNWSRTTREYDSKGRLLLRKEHYFSSSDVYEYSYTYGTNSWTETLIHSRYNTLKSKEFNENVTIDSLTISTRKVWDFAINDWQLSSKFECVNDTINLYSNWKEFTWNLDKEEWKGNWFHESWYFSENQLSHSIQYDWDMLKNDWVYRYKYNSQYNNEGDWIKGEHYAWNPNSNEWYLTSLSNRTFEEAGENFSEYLNYNQLGKLIWGDRIYRYYDEKDMISEYVREQFDQETNNWILSEHNKYFLSPIDGVLPPVNEENRIAKLYPNPVSQILKIRLLSTESVKYDLKLLDLSGKVVFLYESSSLFTSLNLRNLKPGLYIYLLTDGIRKQSGRIVKD